MLWRWVKGRLPSDGRVVVDVVGISPFLREKEARFLVEVEKAAGSFKVLQPEATELVRDHSPHYRDSLLFIEAHLLHGDVHRIAAREHTGRDGGMATP